jgi:hydrogenase expression/formation protein HypD
MKYIDDFRRADLARRIATALADEVDRRRDYRLMEFCGGHTHAIFRYGVQDLVPDNIRFVHGPGCPVCVLPAARIDAAIHLALQHDVILCTYADLMRVPADRRMSLQQARAAGADVRMVYSTRDALMIARDNPGRETVFFAIGFETTTPPTAVAIKQAQAEQLQNFSVFCNHVLTPAAMRCLLETSDDSLSLDGFLGPSHVSTVIGWQPYAAIAETYRRPIVIAGFEPLDIMQSTLMLVRQINAGRHDVENEYTRVVSRAGNTKAQQLVNDVMMLRESFEWRGLGAVPASALRLRPAYAAFDAEQRFELPVTRSREVSGCECPSILRGIMAPPECKLFGTACTPDNPLGSCMVSSEGACAAYWSYRRPRQSVSDRDVPAATAG